MSQCEECLEYVCCHKFPILNIEDDVCFVCLDPYTKSNVSYMNNCNHKCHKNCMDQCIVSVDVSYYEKLIEDRDIDIALILGDEEMPVENKRILVKRVREQYAQQMETRLMKEKSFLCALCRQKNTHLLNYDNMFDKCSETFMPKIGSVNFRRYIAEYDKYKTCIRVTPEMTTYYNELKSLFKEVILADMIEAKKSMDVGTLKRSLFNRK